MRILVLGGAGAVCRHATRDLAGFSTFDEIVVGDYNLPAAGELVADIRDPRVSALKVDAGDDDALVQTFRSFDVVLNGLPWRYDLVVTRACVEAGVSGLDVSTEEDQWSYDGVAREKGIVFVPGVGATPGVTNAMARRGAEQLDEVDTIDIYFAAFRCPAPSPGLLTTFLWEFHPETESRLYYRDGAFHWAGPFEGLRSMHFPGPIGDQEVCYIPHPETRTMPKSLGARAVSVRGCFPPHAMRLARAMLEAAFNVGSGIRVDSPAELDAVGQATQDFVVCGVPAEAADRQVLAGRLERVLRPGGIAFLVAEAPTPAAGPTEHAGLAIARPTGSGPEGEALRLEFQGLDADGGQAITVLRKGGMRPGSPRDEIDPRVVISFGAPVEIPATAAPTSLMKIGPGDETGSHPRYPRWRGVVPLPPDGLMWSAGAPDVENFLVVGDAWAQLVRRHLPPRGMVLDVGCGCGRLARVLAADSAVGGYVGFDCIRGSITWCETHVLPAAAGKRCEFHHLDARSAEYNPAGTLRGEDVRFPCGTGSMDLVVAASLFTHLLEPDAACYLREIARVLKPAGMVLLTIRATAAPGVTYAGNEGCIDVDRQHFLAMARAAGLDLRDEVADFVGETLLVMKAGEPAVVAAASAAEAEALSGA